MASNGPEGGSSRLSKTERAGDAECEGRDGSDPVMPGTYEAEIIELREALEARLRRGAVRTIRRRQLDAEDRSLLRDLRSFLEHEHEADVARPLMLDLVSEIAARVYERS